MTKVGFAKTIERRVSVWRDSRGYHFVTDAEPIMDTRFPDTPAGLREAPIGIEFAARGATQYWGQVEWQPLRKRS